MVTTFFIAKDQVSLHVCVRIIFFFVMLSFLKIYKPGNSWHFCNTLTFNRFLWSPKINFILPHFLRNKKIKWKSLSVATECTHQWWLIYTAAKIKQNSNKKGTRQSESLQLKADPLSDYGSVKSVTGTPSSIADADGISNWKTLPFEKMKLFEQKIQQDFWNLNCGGPSTRSCLDTKRLLQQWRQ